MISRFACSILLVFVISSQSYGQTKIDCQAALERQLDTSGSLAWKVFRDCGGFTGEDSLLVQGPVLWTVIESLANGKVVTYGELFAAIEKIRQDEKYPMILEAFKALKEVPATAGSKPATASFTKMISYKAAVKEANEKHKPLFLYFTSRYSSGSRQIEKGLLADSEVKAVLDKYVRYVASVDDAEIAKLQTEKFKSELQPYFVIIAGDKKIAEFTGSTGDKEEFMEFLREGLK